MKTSDFDYYLPEELIAQKPAVPRDSSRLLVIDRARESFDHRSFREIIEYLNPGDTLVMNDSRVIPARLIGRKDTPGIVEGHSQAGKQSEEGQQVDLRQSGLRSCRAL